MPLPWRPWLLLPLVCCLGGDPRFQGPVFTQEPGDTVFPVGTEGRAVTLSCEARGSPSPRYRWQLNGTDVDLSQRHRYQLLGGNLVVLGPDRHRDAGSYQCFATNSLGTVVSREARLQFAYLEAFPSKPRGAVSVRAGQGVVLLCGPPPHSGELSYAWIFNEYPVFVQEDRRRFVSQETGHLYIAKVEPWDVGSYTCVVTSVVTGGRVLGPPTPLVLRADGVMGEYEPKIEVQFPETLPAAKGTTVRLECFALGNPVPQISWRRGDGLPFPSKARLHKFNGVLEIPSFQQEDAGAYECLAENGRGRNVARGRLTYHAQPHWVQPIRDVEAAVEDSLRWECRASGKPRPSYRWWKDGAALALQERVQVEDGALTISSLRVADSGMFQCIAENKHGRVYASAQLRVLASAPSFAQTPMKQLLQVHEGSEVTVSCQPGAAPRPRISWKKGPHSLREGHRVRFLEDGALRIANVTRADAGAYTCTAENQFGKANGTTRLVVTEPTRMTVAPASLDVSVGESLVLPCQVRHDPQLHPAFSWYFDGEPAGFQKDSAHLERVGGSSSGDLLIRNAQLRHSGRYTCVVQTEVDSVSSTADLIVREPSAPPSRVSAHSLSSSEIQVTWSAAPWKASNGRLLGYEVRYWSPGDEAAARHVTVAGNGTSATLRGLKSRTPHLAAVRAYNSAGPGPFSTAANATTRKAPPSQPPGNVVWNSTGSSVLLSWECVRAAENESEVTGYKVLYRASGQTTARVLSTNQTSAELQLPTVGDYIIQVKATTAGGDGASSEQIRVPGLSRPAVRGSAPARRVPLLLCFLLGGAVL
ncbi:contactin-3 isoform X3 [Sorex araneus]|uniref:contactin-3 isoform X3 n=1 Tax=Sorex araneus TaxID=42254 RepID=UPI0024337F01|nr:contactin-3 isoform X3 [Sorex araneus]